MSRQRARRDWNPTIYDDKGNLDHARKPLVEGIEAFRQQGIMPFSTPGHKQGQGIDSALIDLYGVDCFRSDIPVSGGVDTIHFHWETVRLAERLGADAWGSDDCFYLVNGSSTGNIAFLLASLKPGDTVLVARDVHKSLMVALIHAGVKPVYVAPRLHQELDVGLGMAAGDVALALDEHPEAKLVIVVSPSYCGVPSDLESIARLVHERDVMLYVDEAWGPHFHFHPELPSSAIASGADGAVTSTHKMLGAFTQSAVLNVQGNSVDKNAIEVAVGMSQTTSPAAFILATIDACRSDMALRGLQLLDRTIELAEKARSELETISGLTVLDASKLGISQYDLTKLVIDVHGLGLTGIEVELRLRYDFDIIPEMSDGSSVICLITVGDTTESIARLVAAFAEISSCRVPGFRPGRNRNARPLRSSGAAISPGVQAMTPRDAFFAKTETISYANAVGRVAAELVIPYPPGIPVLAPGDVISQDKVAYLAAAVAFGTYISGAAHGAETSIRVVRE